MILKGAELFFEQVGHPLIDQLSQHTDDGYLKAGHGDYQRTHVSQLSQYELGEKRPSQRQE